MYFFSLFFACPGCSLCVCETGGFFCEDGDGAAVEGTEGVAYLSGDEERGLGSDGCWCLCVCVCGGEGRGEEEVVTVVFDVEVFEGEEESEVDCMCVYICKCASVSASA